MPVLFNYDSIEETCLQDGLYSRQLITPERVKSDCILLDRWVIKPNKKISINVEPKDIVWFQILEGSALLTGTNLKENINTDHVVFLPPNFSGTIESEEEVIILYGRVPRADRYDPNFDPNSMSFRCVNWRKEPTLDSEHDKRTRIYLVTPTLFGTKAIKGEMIIYPPGTSASNHHHEGAEHFQYIISGKGTALLSEEPHQARAGDTLYNYEYERHNFINDGDEELVFVEYFVPAECKTVWVSPETTCAWIPTGSNIDGGDPSRDMKAHSSAEVINPEGV
jgi:quercetin dioxygenase-like cupin family protein